MTRLLSVIHGPAFGGAHNQLVRLAEPLRARGIETVALLPAEAADVAARIRAEGVETAVVPFGRIRAVADPRVQLRFLRSCAGDVGRMRRVIRELGIDVVQAHGPTHPQAAVAGRLEGTGVVWQVLDTRAPMALRRPAVAVLTRTADAATVWGNALIEQHPGLERLGDRLVTVFPPVDVESFAPSAGRATRARARLSLPKQAISYGSIGVLNPQKGHEYLIAAAELLAPDHPDARLRILGAPSPGHDAYGARLGDAARRLGERDSAIITDPGRGVADLIQALDVFVLPSVRRSEGMPTAILEAMAAGKPVVATDVGAVPELVEDGVTGRIVPPEDAGAIAAAVGELLERPELRTAMGRAGRLAAARRFDLARLADLHAHAYELAITRRADRAPAAATGPRVGS